MISLRQLRFRKIILDTLGILSILPLTLLMRGRLLEAILKVEQAGGGGSEMRS
jgi:hypothetical protein